MAKNPFDPAEIFKAFSPDAMAKALDPNAMMNAFQEAGKNLPDLADVFDANKRHFEATAEANKAAAAGYKDMLIEPYMPHIEPILEGSAIAFYRLKKSNGQSALSYEGLVKITRKLPSGELCGPAANSAPSSEVSTAAVRFMEWVRRIVK